MTSQHNQFIKSPIYNIIKDTIIANSCVGNGIETFPLSDYILQSTFLKMTGFQEQKFKCLTWEMATHDFEYRRKLLNDGDKLGECSTYKAKSAVFKNLLGLIKNIDSEFKISRLIDNRKIRILVKDIMKDSFNNSNVCIWNHRMYITFIKEFTTIFQNNQFLISKSSSNGENCELFSSTLQDHYTRLYKHRNRCAHNTISYQHNLPTLKTLQSESFKSENYFIWFSILILIDEIFMKIYNKYMELLESDPYC